MTATPIAHAGLLALRFGRDWRGALVMGASGAGKSDLMLRALEAGFRLVSDDRTHLWVSAGRLFGRAPDPIAGLIEARGVGIVSLIPLPSGPVDLVVRCAAPGEPIERIPPPEGQALLNVELPLLLLHALEPSAPAKLRRALSRLGGRGREA